MSCSSQWCWNTSCSYKNPLESKGTFDPFNWIPFPSNEYSYKALSFISFSWIPSNRKNFISFKQYLFYPIEGPAEHTKWRKQSCSLFQSICLPLCGQTVAIQDNKGQTLFASFCSIWTIYLNERNKRKHRWAMWISFSCFSWKRNFWKGSLFSWRNRACSFPSTEGWPNRPNKANERSRLKATLTREFHFFVKSIQLKKFSFASISIWKFPQLILRNLHFIWVKDGLLKETDETKAQFIMMHPFLSDEDQKSFILFNWILKTWSSIY